MYNNDLIDDINSINIEGATTQTINKITKVNNIVVISFSGLYSSIIPSGTQIVGTVPNKYIPHVNARATCTLLDASGNSRIGYVVVINDGRIELNTEATDGRWLIISMSYIL